MTKGPATEGAGVGDTVAPTPCLKGAALLSNCQLLPRRKQALTSMIPPTLPNLGPSSFEKLSLTFGSESTLTSPFYAVY